MNDDNLFVCDSHFADNDLIRFINEEGETGRSCCICNENRITVNSNNRDLQESVRGLIRYFYPEYVYNEHFGGVDFHQIFNDSNPILVKPESVTLNDDSPFWYVVDDLLDGLDSEHIIPLYAGHIEEMRDLFAKSLRDNGYVNWNESKKLLLENNYTEVLPQFHILFHALLHRTMTTVPAGKVYSRARIGFDVQKERGKLSQAIIEKKIPYREKNILAPPPNITPSGRANRERISYYYLASTIATAIAEVRPHPGHYVSIANFELTENIKVANLSSFGIKDYIGSEEDFDNYVALRAFAYEFEFPITPDAKNRYLFSQMLSDIIKMSGLDGIMFNSSIGKGVNIVVFDKSKVKFKQNSRRLYFIKKHSYECSRVTNVYDGFVETYTEQFGPTVRK
jgi:hypothetical protein